MVIPQVMHQQNHAQKHSQHNAHNNVYRQQTGQQQTGQLKQAGELLRRGGIVVYPTDTAYAIGCTFRNQAAIKKIMALKGRTDPKFTIIASSQYQVEKYFTLTTAQKKLAIKFWPGALSIVINTTMAVRVPDHAIARSLARRAGEPLIATSINISGQSPVYSIAELKKRFPKLFQHIQNPPDSMYIDAGVLKPQPPSTVVECVSNTYTIHRQGKIRVT